jgi:hypothetical protein
VVYSIQANLPQFDFGDQSASITFFGQKLIQPRQRRRSSFHPTQPFAAAPTNDRFGETMPLAGTAIMGAKLPVTARLFCVHSAPRAGVPGCEAEPPRSAHCGRAGALTLYLGAGEAAENLCQFL